VSETIDQISKVHRPVLGEDIPIFVFRAFRHFTANYVTQMLGRSATTVFQNAGRDLGRDAGALLKRPTLDEYLKEVVTFTTNLRIGNLKPVEINQKHMILGLEECITCVGMDNIGKRICHFEVGFVAGIVEAFTGTRVRGHESKCNAAGEGICEVTIDLGEA